MNIEEIISNALEKTAKGVTEKVDNGLPSVAGIADPELVEIYKNLIIYSNNLLSAYHEELRKTLAEQWIKI